MNFKILTLFPEAIKPYTDSSIIGRAQKDGYVNIEYFNIRDYSKGKHRRVDDTPYGGGFGMVMTPQPADALIIVWHLNLKSMITLSLCADIMKVLTKELLTKL